MNVIQEAKQAAAILRDWVGDGGQPVPPEQAEARARCCTSGGPGGRPCPHNWLGSWQWKMTVANAIRKQLELRGKMNIRLKDEGSVGICEACGCALRLKLHVPFIHIYRHTSDALLARYPDFCWQKQELNQLKHK